MVSLSGHFSHRSVQRLFVGVRVILRPIVLWSEDKAEYRLTFDMTQQSQFCISAPELLIPKDEPFRFDRLKRKPSCDLLTQLATRVDGPCTISIDARWGHGKTTFLRLWASHLKQNAFVVIDVNAWETDYFDDPFLAIVGEMTNKLETSDQVDFSKQSGLSKLKKCSAKVASIAPRVLVSRIGMTGEDYAKIASTFKTEASIWLEQYKDQLASVEAFRTELENVAKEVRRQTEKPLIVLIDELDRCRPTYAVEFLEVVKHLMAVDRVVYAFAMNRSELAHTVSGCYGPKFDGKGYLRRFFDVDFTLPESSRRSFIKSLFEDQLESLITDFHTRRITRRMLLAFFDVERISLRQIQQALYRFQLAMLLSQEDLAQFPKYAIEFCTALILRVYDPDILEKFLRGELTDEDVVDRSLPSSVQGNANLHEAQLNFELTVIRAYQEIAGPNPSTRDYNPTPLLLSYKKLVTPTSVTSNANPEIQFAHELVDLVDRYANPQPSLGRATGVPHRFKLVVSQLEMLEQLKTTNYS